MQIVIVVTADVVVTLNLNVTVVAHVAHANVMVAVVVNSHTLREGACSLFVYLLFSYEKYYSLYSYRCNSFCMTLTSCDHMAMMKQIFLIRTRYCHRQR